MAACRLRLTKDAPFPEKDTTSSWRDLRSLSKEKSRHHKSQQKRHIFGPVRTLVRSSCGTAFSTQVALSFRKSKRYKQTCFAAVIESELECVNASIHLQTLSSHSVSSTTSGDCVSGCEEPCQSHFSHFVDASDATNFDGQIVLSAAHQGPIRSTLTSQSPVLHLHLEPEKWTEQENLSYSKISVTPGYRTEALQNQDVIAAQQILDIQENVQQKRPEPAHVQHDMNCFWPTSNEHCTCSSEMSPLQSSTDLARASDTPASDLTDLSSEIGTPSSSDEIEPVEDFCTSDSNSLYIPAELNILDLTALEYALNHDGIIFDFERNDSQSWAGDEISEAEGLMFAPLPEEAQDDFGVDDEEWTSSFGFGSATVE